MAKTPDTPGPVRRFEASEWRKIIARYTGGDAVRSFRQVVVTVLGLAASLYAAHWLMERWFWPAFLMIPLIIGFQTRSFIIMHDCSHASFLPWSQANDAIGFLMGVLTFTPFAQWRREHALHHASAGDLDHRGFGDITTLTVEEYQKLTRFRKLQYRLYRHPFVLFGIGPMHLMLLQRFKLNGPATGAKQQWNIWMTNLAIVGLTWMFVLVAGWKSVFLIYYPAMYLAGAFGIWLFYVQHQFEEAYWERGQQWDYATAAITGSSHLRLPGWLNWFTGHIGLHHVHHLGPKIPNYRLKRAHEENPIFAEAPVLTFRTAWRTLRLTLWDEANKRMIGFREYRQMLRAGQLSPHGV